MTKENKPQNPSRDCQARIPDLLEKAGYSPEAASALLDLDSGMFQWKSAFMKGEVPVQMIQELGVDLDLTQFRFLTAITRIQGGIGRPEPQAATIGGVAEELNVDPSRASRLAADLIQRGYLRREAAQDDGRKSILVLTDSAEQVFSRFRELRWTKFMAIFADWDTAEIADFSRLFGKYLKGARRELYRKST
ncbi:MAG: MarR family winged helix-turn-helix transcriptional regulator [Marinosulfonomonas sp.]